MQNIQLFIIGLFTILIFSVTANAANWTVTKATNSNDNLCDADCSLREAVFKADSGDTVVFSPNLIGQTITLGGSEIVITKRITIDGFINDPNVAFISGNNTSRIFLIETGGALDLRNATLVQGNGVSSNFGSGYGGAIYAKNGTVLSLDRVGIRANTVAQLGGGIVAVSANVHIINSSFTSNSATSYAAMLINYSTVNMANVTISGNFDNNINDSDDFGAISLVHSSNVTIRNSTVTNNKAGRSAILVGTIPGDPPGNFNFGNTIVAGNEFTTGGDIDDIYSNSNTISAGGNLIGSTFHIPAGTFTQPNDIMNVNPLLAPTNSNQGGFPIATHPLQAGSPARNGGLNQNAVDPLTNQPLTFDARGANFPRIAAGTVDIGAFEDQSGDTSLIVTKNTNSNDFVCDTDCSLREAVYQASVNSGTDTITFAPNVFGNLSTDGSEFLIQNQNVNIVGYPTSSAETLRITGGNANRIFHLNNATANISGMALTNGDAGANFGGAVLAENNSNLTLDKVIVRNNLAAAYGAIFLSGGTARIVNSTINNNSANTGLAIGVSGTLDMANTTVSTNFDADGGAGIGAIYVTGTANIRNSTIAFNRTSGGTGGGIFNAGTLNLGNTIVSNNTALTSPDLHQSSGTITSVGGNLISNSNGFPVGTFGQTNDAVNVDPQLAALADNGGNVPTHLLMPNSAAINGGINANALDPFDNSVLTADSRGTGFDRIQNSTVDKGAFESLAPTAAGVSISGRVTTLKGRGLADAQVYLTNRTGNSRVASTDSTGNYQFENVPSGEIYIINVVSKRHQFNPQIITILEGTSELNFLEVSF